MNLNKKITYSTVTANYMINSHNLAIPYYQQTSKLINVPLLTSSKNFTSYR